MDAEFAFSHRCKCLPFSPFSLPFAPSLPFPCTFPAAKWPTQIHI